MPTDVRYAGRGVRAGGGPSRVMLWLLVPVVACLGGCAMVLQAMPVPGETLADLAAAPDVWGMRLIAVLPGVMPSWIALTVTGLATGLMIFLMASGLTLLSGLMGVINFGHGAFVALGAFVGVSVLARVGDWTASTVLALNLAAVGAAALVAMAAAGAAGALFDRVIVRPVGGARLKQILVTVGGLVIVEQLIEVTWGPAQMAIDRPAAMTGTVTIQGVAMDIQGLLTVAVGLAGVALVAFVLRGTRLGLVTRAAMQDWEMVQALGYRLRAIGVVVFIAGAALAALGGVLWALQQQVVTAQMGADLMVLVFVTVIIGGLGSVTGCLLAALMVGLTQGYAATFDPDLARVPVLVLMVLVLSWRPAGMLARQSLPRAGRSP